MAISRSKKEEDILDLISSFEEAKLSVLTNYQGLTAEQINNLRSQLRESDISYKVVKNTLVRIALDKSKLDLSDKSIFDGPVAIAFGNDEAGAAKIVANFSKENESLEIIGAIDCDGQLLSAEQVKALSNLPSREELIAGVVGTIAAPISSFVNALEGNIRNLVYVLEAIKQVKN
jgi:large subunit ribosomal protein L10